MGKKKAVLVTGGASGIGYKVAERLLQDGCHVIIADSDINLVNEKVCELNAKYNARCLGVKYQPLNAKFESENVFSEISDKGFMVDRLVCAQEDYGLGQDSLSTDLCAWENVLKWNVTGAYMPARTMVKRLQSLGYQGGGSVVFIGSTLEKSAISGRSSFIASKGAISSMTRALAIDFSKYKIRVNCVEVGGLKLENLGVLKQEKLASEQTVIPLGEKVSEEQVANAVCFLLSSYSSGITGASLVVDGGLDCVIPGAF